MRANKDERNGRAAGARQAHTSSLLLLALVLWAPLLVWCLGAQLGVARASASAGAGVSVQPDDRLKRFEAWKKSPLYVAPFDPDVLALPDVQVAFIRNMTASDLGLFREIVEEALRIRNKWTPSVKLMFKYAGRLINTFIRNRRDEQRIELRVEPRPEFFGMLAELVQAVIDRSGPLKRERGYSKGSVDEAAFKGRVFALFDYVQRIMNASPLAGYHKWTELKLFTDEPENALHKSDLVEEASDLLAQFRAMGYESTVFVGRRIVGMLRLFSRGIVPSSDKEV